MRASTPVQSHVRNVPIVELVRVDLLTQVIEPEGVELLRVRIYIRVVVHGIHREVEYGSGR